MSDFSDRLKLLRKQSGLNQTAFGLLGGVTKDTQLNYENGSRKPDIDYMGKLAESGLDVHFLLTGVTVGDTLNEDELAVLRGYRGLNEQAKLGVKALLLGISPGAQVSNNFKGDVGQVVDGNIMAPQTFTFSKKNKK